MTGLLFVILVVSIWALNSRISDNEEQIKFLRKKYETLLSKSSNFEEKVIAKPYENEEPVQQVESDNISAENIKEENIDVWQEEDEEEVEEKFAKENVLKQKPQVDLPIKKTMESWIMGNLFNIIGGLAIIIAIGIFLKSISEFITFTPLLKTIIGLLSGFGLIFGSYKIKDDKLKIYSEIMLGTGFSALFVTVILTTMLFQTFTIPVCIALSVLLLLYAYYVADKQKSISMISISLIGGYLIAIMMQNMEVTDSCRWFYLLFLNLLSIIYVFKNYDKNIINVVNLSVTTLFAVLNTDVNLIYPITLSSIYLLTDYALRWKNEEKYDSHGILNWLNFGSVILLSSLIFDQFSKLNLAFLLMGICFVYDLLVCLSILKKKTNYETYVHTLITSVFLLVHFIPLGIIRILALAILSLLLLFVAKKVNKHYLEAFSYSFLTATITNMFFVQGVCYDISIEKYVPILNKRLLFFLVPILNCACVLYILKNDTKSLIKHVIRLSLISLVFLYSAFEINAFLTWFLGIDDRSLNATKWLTYSILGFNYAIRIKYFSIKEKIDWLNSIAYFVAITSIIILLSASVLYLSVIPFFNMRLVAMLFAIISIYLFSKWENKPEFNYLSTFLGFIFLTAETKTFADVINCKEDYLISIIWVIYAGALSLIGIAKNNKVLKKAGICFSTTAVMKIIVDTIAYAATFQKALTFVILGAIFMIVSYYYNKNNKG